MGDLFSTAGTSVEGRAARMATAWPEGDGPAMLEVFEAQLLGQAVPGVAASIEDGVVYQRP